MKGIQLIMKVFAFVGGVALLAGLFVGIRTANFIHRATHADGEVVRLEARRTNNTTAYAPVVSYKTSAGLATLTSPTASYPPSFHPGQHVDVLYDSADVSDARIATFGQLWGATGVLVLFGSAFSGIGLSGIYIAWRRRQGAIHLRQSGKRVVADYKEVIRNPEFALNGQNPFQIILEWRDPDSGGAYLFHSENFWYDPSKYVSTKTFNVYLKPGDVSTYYVDTSLLPKMADDA